MSEDYKLLHYKSLKEMNNQLYDGVLTVEHLDDEEKHFDKWKKLATGEDEKEINFACYCLEKEGKKYLVRSFNPSKHPDEGQRLDIYDLLPIKVNDSYAVAAKNVVYEVANDIQPLRFTEEKTMSFKELVDVLSSFHHTKPKWQKLYWMTVLAGYFDRAYARISTTPNFGKDSALNVLELLKGRSNSVNAEVTRAKLEFLTTQKILGVTELADLTGEDWRNIEQFLLDVADFTPTIPKRSRSYDGVGETLDIDEFSVMLLYNDLKDYNDQDRYFDKRAKSAVDDRFPPLRLPGEIDDNRLESVEQRDVAPMVEEGMPRYKDMLRALEYWEKNFDAEQNDEWEADFSEYGKRWRKNLLKITKAINLYSESEEEFNEYVHLLHKAINEYDLMLQYVPVFEQTTKDMPEQKKRELRKELDKMDMYTDKIALLNDVQKTGYSSGSGYKGIDDF